MSRHRRPILVGALLIALGGVGCDGGSEGGSSTPLEESGALHVRTVVDDGLSGTMPWTLDRAPILTFGGLDAPSEEVVLRAVSAFPVGDSAIAIADMGTNNVRIVSYAGRILRVLGRSGEGPGEFTALSAALPLGDSAIAAWDFGGSMTAFRLVDGSVHTEARGVSRQLGVLDWPVPTPSGGLFVRGVPRGDGVPDPRPEYRAERFVAYVAPGSQHLDTLLIADGPEVFRVETWIKKVPAGADLLIAGGGLPFRFVAFDTGTSSLRIWDAQGVLQAVVEWPHVVERYTAVQWKRVVEEALQNEPSASDGYQPALEALPWDRVRSRYRGLFVDQAGWVWIQRQRRFDSNSVPPVDHWEIFDTTGTWRGRMALPSLLRPLHIGLDLVIGATKDEFDVESVLVYRLNRSQRRE